MTVREEFSKFIHSTSVKGVSRLFKADCFEIKVLWAVAVTTCFAFGFFQTYKLFGDVFPYATATQIKRHRLNASDPEAYQTYQTYQTYKFVIPIHPGC